MPHPAVSSSPPAPPPAATVPPDARWYRSLFVEAPEPMWCYDRETLRFVDVNDAAVAAYGWSRAELLTMTVLDVRPPDERDAARAAMAAHAAAWRGVASAAYHGTHRHWGKDGRERWVEVRARDVDDPSGRPVRLALLRDVTQARATELARRALEENVRRAQSLALLGRLAGGITHDFNNLLAVVKAGVELAEAALPPGHPAAADLADVREAATRGAALTRQLLSQGRTTLAAPAAHPAPDLVREALRLGRRLLPPNVRLREPRWPAGAPPVLWVDRTRFEQVLLNLVVNARDAMPDGGLLRVSAARARRAAGVGSGRRTRFLRLRVADTGVGMDAATRARAFEPLFTTKGDRGTGLGLSTVAALVEEAGGYVAFDSEPGRGTRVDVFFPEEDAGRAAPPAAAGSPSDVGRVVLLAEDDPALRRLTRRLLERDGHVVHTVSDGRAALARWEALGGAVDVVLADVALPGLDGWGVARALRARGAEQPIALLMGDAGREAGARGDADPAALRVAVYAKPVPPDALRAMVRAARSAVVDRPA